MKSVMHQFACAVEKTTTPADPLHAGRRTYGRVCRKLRINPIGVVRRGLLSNSLVVTQRGLSDRDTLAICNALLVGSSSHLQRSSD